MAFKWGDRVKDTTTTTGTGTITVSGTAPTGYQAFGAVFATSDTFHYAIVAQGAADWEVGLGTLASSTTFGRTTVLASSNAGAAVSFSAGTKDVWCDVPAAFLKDPKFNSVTLSSGMILDNYTSAETLILRNNANTQTWLKAIGSDGRPAILEFNYLTLGGAGCSIGSWIDGPADHIFAENANKTVVYFHLADDNVANVMAQRYGTNAQTYRLYNTFTDTSNYERVSLGWSSNVCYLRPENAGSGSARILMPVTGMTTLSALGSAATAGAGAKGFISDAQTLSAYGTVTGGGSIKMAVESDGTDWKGFANSAATGSGDMLASNNLSDVASKVTARANLQVPSLGLSSALSTTYAGPC